MTVMTGDGCGRQAGRSIRVGLISQASGGWMSRSSQVVIQSQDGRARSGCRICMGTAVLSSLWLIVKCQASTANQVKGWRGIRASSASERLPKVPNHRFTLITR